MNKKDYETPVAMVIELKVESHLLTESETINQGGNNTGNGDSRRDLWEEDEED